MPPTPTIPRSNVPVATGMYAFSISSKKWTTLPSLTFAAMPGVNSVGYIPSLSSICVLTTSVNGSTQFLLHAYFLRVDGSGGSASTWTTSIMKFPVAVNPKCIMVVLGDGRVYFGASQWGCTSDDADAEIEATKSLWIWSFDPQDLGTLESAIEISVRPINHPPPFVDLAAYSPSIAVLNSTAIALFATSYRLSVYINIESPTSASATKQIVVLPVNDAYTFYTYTVTFGELGAVVGAGTGGALIYWPIFTRKQGLSNTPTSVSYDHSNVLLTQALNEPTIIDLGELLFSRVRA
jgi:hypothetical protein